MNTARFSIVIPVYNVASYLRTCLDSIVLQTFPNWEAICVDDGSADGSGVILDEYAARDRRIRVIHQENKGVCLSRQIGLDAATGEYVTWADPDDWLSLDYLESANQFLLKNEGVDFLWLDFLKFRDGVETRVVQQPACSVDANIAFLIDGALHGSTCNKIIKRKFILQADIRFPNRRIAVCEDLVFVLSCLRANPHIGYVPKAFYHYRWVATSVGHSLHDENYYESIKYVGDTLLRQAQDEEQRSAVMRWRRVYRFESYSNPRVTDKFFYAFFPEACQAPRGLGTRTHRLLFALSCRGFRSFVMIMAWCLRFVKGTLV